MRKTRSDHSVGITKQTEAMPIRRITKALFIGVVALELAASSVAPASARTGQMPDSVASALRAMGATVFFGTGHGGGNKVIYKGTVYEVYQGHPSGRWMLKHPGQDWRIPKELINQDGDVLLAHSNGSLGPFLLSVPSAQH